MKVTFDFGDEILQGPGGVQETAFDPTWIFFVIQLFMWFRQLQNPDAPPIPMPPMPPMMQSTDAA